MILPGGNANRTRRTLSEFMQRASSFPTIGSRGVQVNQIDGLSDGRDAHFLHGTTPIRCSSKFHGPPQSMFLYVRTDNISFWEGRVSRDIVKAAVLFFRPGSRG